MKRGWISRLRYCSLLLKQQRNYAYVVHERQKDRRARKPELSHAEKYSPKKPKSPQQTQREAVHFRKFFRKQRPQQSAQSQRRSHKKDVRNNCRQESHWKCECSPLRSRFAVCDPSIRITKNATTTPDSHNSITRPQSDPATLNRLCVASAFSEKSSSDGALIKSPSARTLKRLHW